MRFPTDRPAFHYDILPTSIRALQRLYTVCNLSIVATRAVLASLCLQFLGMSTVSLMLDCMSDPPLSSLQSVIINKTSANDDLKEAKAMFFQTHGKSIIRMILHGFAGLAPRSANPNLIELLSVMVTRTPGETRTWMAEVLYAVRVTGFCFARSRSQDNTII